MGIGDEQCFAIEKLGRGYSDCRSDAQLSLEVGVGVVWLP